MTDMISRILYMLLALPPRTTILLLCTLSLLHLRRLPAANAKVVVFLPTPGTSHIRYHTNVARALAQMGHQAWVGIPDYMARQPGRYDTADINVLTYGHSLGDVESRWVNQSRIHRVFWENKTQTVRDIMLIGNVFEKVITDIMDGDLFEKVQAVKPDMCVVDGIPFVRPFFVIPYKLDIPYAMLGTMHETLASRVPVSPAATPLPINLSSDRMDFMNRLKSASFYLLMWTYHFVLEKDSVSKYAPEKAHTSINDIIARSEIFIAELDIILDYPRPMLPNTKLVGGTAATPTKPLREPFKSFVENSKRGVIVVSFGSTARRIPEYIFDKINAACLSSGLNVVWRSEQTSPDVSRIFTSEWIPQNDLLGHNNTVLFLSHCGKNGQYEALYHGVPILCMPIFGDQPYNAERVKVKGYGLGTDIRFVSREDLTQMVRELLTNATYRDTITKASRLFRQLYKTPMKEAAFWLDHVIQHGGAYMRSSSQTMPFYQFMMLDILALLVVVGVVASLVTFYIFRLCFRCLFGRRDASKKPKSE